MMERATLHHADCRDAMRAMEAESVDAVVTDPPYGLAFMGREWDHGVPGVEFWREALRVAKPGAHLVAFGGTRTFHRLACAIEDAGWEVRDCLSWLYGSGFPKSLDVSKAIDKAAGVEREVVGERTFRGKAAQDWREKGGDNFNAGAPSSAGCTRTVGITSPATDAARAWQGWGTALKPAWEPIVLARKPLDGTVAANVLAHGTGALNIDATRIASDGEHMRHGIIAKQTSVSGDDRSDSAAGMYAAGASFTPTNHPGGRWPANVALDEEAAAMLGEPSRFFYTAKASRSERGDGNTHPTVKPIALMRWLVRLVTPPGGLVLDPFNGSGSTSVAALAEGMRYVGCEREAEYVEITRRRLALPLDDDDQECAPKTDANGQLTLW